MAAAAAPWAGLFPPVPEDFVREGQQAFIPLYLGVGGVCLLATLMLSRGHRFWDRVLFFFFFLSMIIHFGLEQYYVLHYDKILDKSVTCWPARVWRHYGVSDTRWLGQSGPNAKLDPAIYGCIWSLEWLAAYLCGPTIVLTMLLYIIKSPWRWPVQCVSVTAQAYGLFITWIPAYYEKLRSVAKNDPVLFYGYFWGWQLPWMIVPICAVVQSGLEISKIFRKAKLYDEQQSRSKKTK